MKKAVSLLLAFCLFCGIFSVFSFASSSDAEEYVFDDIGTINVCTYDSESKKINISGNIDHDVLVAYNKYYIALYSIPYGVNHNEYLKSEEAVQLAKTDISIKFEFSVKAETNSERFSSYCVVIMNETGDVIPVSYPKYPNQTSSYVFKEGDKSSYKGVSSAQTSIAVASNASSSIVPVYLNKLLSNASVGHFYSLQGSYIYFDKQYIDELDVRIKSLSATGSAVYLQFLLDSSANSSVSSLGTSGIPDMSVRQNLDLICAFTDFLCERYDDRYAGSIQGIILGKDIDLNYVNSAVPTLDVYAENYIRYLTVVGNVAFERISNIDMTIPFSDVDAYSETRLELLCSPSELLELICEILDKSLSSELIFSTMIETEEIPYNISDDTLKNGGFKAEASDVLNADSIWHYSSYIASLKSKYKNVPHSYIFVWDVPFNVSYNVLSCTYAYSYFKLMADSRLSSFVVSFEDIEGNEDKSSFSMLSKLLREIDTSESFSVTAPQLELFGAESWYEVISNMYGGNFNLKKIMKFPELRELPSDILGSYAYFDFSYQTDISSWFKGAHCDSLKIDYNDVSGRSLEAHFKNDITSPSEFAELYCAYEYHENFAYTPYMAMSFSLENDSNDKSSLYEVKVSLGSKANIAETSVVCAPYEEVNLLLDFTEFNQTSMAEYIVISVRELSGRSEGYSICFASMDGYSETYLSDELSNLISEERLRIRNMLEDDSDSSEKRVSTALIITGAVIIIAVIALGIFICFKRDDEDED